jgi:hypothetical protein
LELRRLRAKLGWAGIATEATAGRIGIAGAACPLRGRAPAQFKTLYNAEMDDRSFLQLQFPQISFFHDFVWLCSKAAKL